MSTTTRDEIIAEEQKAVDRTYDCYEQRLAELTGGSIASASASGKDNVANRKDAEDKAAEYASLGDASLVVSRVDTQDAPNGKPDTWYVGRRAVSDVATRDTIVVLWTTPLAKKWSTALPDAPDEVLLRRQLRCAQRVDSTSSTSVTRRWPVQSTLDIGPRPAASPTCRLVEHRGPRDHSRNGEPQ